MNIMITTSGHFICLHTHKKRIRHYLGMYTYYLETRIGGVIGNDACVSSIWCS